MQYGVQYVNIWLDSSDFRVAKKAGKRGLKSDKWSFKLNSPGRRFMFACDGKVKVRRLWGGYSPKVHDGTFLELMHESIEQELHSAHVIGDQHFAKGRRLFDEILFYTPFKQPSTPKPDAEGLAMLT